MNPGGDGRFLLGDNTHSFQGTLERARSEPFAGPNGDNPFLPETGGNPQRTPTIVGLAGGAEAFGLLGVDAQELFTLDVWQQGPQGPQGPQSPQGPGDDNAAKAALVRVDQVGDDVIEQDARAARARRRSRKAEAPSRASGWRRPCAAPGGWSLSLLCLPSARTGGRAEAAAPRARGWKPRWDRLQVRQLPGSAKLWSASGSWSARGDRKAPRLGMQEMRAGPGPAGHVSRPS
mgnify:CR=1 FL=1